MYRAHCDITTGIQYIRITSGNWHMYHLGSIALLCRANRNPLRYYNIFTHYYGSCRRGHPSTPQDPAVLPVP